MVTVARALLTMTSGSSTRHADVAVVASAGAASTGAGSAGAGGCGWMSMTRPSTRTRSTCAVADSSFHSAKLDAQLLDGDHRSMIAAVELDVADDELAEHAAVERADAGAAGERRLQLLLDLHADLLAAPVGVERDQHDDDREHGEPEHGEQHAADPARDMRGHRRPTAVERLAGAEEPLEPLPRLGVGRAVAVEAIAEVEAHRAIGV